MRKRCLRKSVYALQDQRGYSLIELLIVILIGTIIAGATILSFSTQKKYAPDDQALKILDIVQEARQRAINQKSIMRVEFNKTKNLIRLIDENEPGKSNDDLVIKTMTQDTSDVTVGVHPNNVSLTTVPAESSPVAEMVFSNSQYPSSKNQSVFTLCFVKDGRVVDTSADGSCSGTNTLRGATVYVFAKADSNNYSSLVRALTVSGTTSAGTVYKCVMTGAACTAWKK